MQTSEPDGGEKSQQPLVFFDLETTGLGNLFSYMASDRLKYAVMPSSFHVLLVTRVFVF